MEVNGEHRFSVYNRVIGSQRPRFSHGHTYTPKPTKDYRDAIRAAYVASCGPMFSGPIGVRIDVHRALPRSRPKSVSSEPDTYKPDADNIAKVVLDALNGVAYDDDAAVCELIVKKHPRTRIEEHISVTIYAMDIT